MKLIETEFRGLFILEPKVIEDSRGYFMETYHAKIFEQYGLNFSFVQDNQSKSKRHVLRGLHFQNAPYAQTKLVRALSGSIMDVVVDLRRSESTFGKVFTVELSDVNKRQLLVPKGFAHGFVVLTETAEVFYKSDEFYNPEAESGINFLDEALNLKSLIGVNNFVLSEKDKKYPNLHEAQFNF
jgi:dTDP-4-dehydrorhamnose 3,5-epimerase